MCFSSPAIFIQHTILYVWQLFGVQIAEEEKPCFIILLIIAKQPFGDGPCYTETNQKEKKIQQDTLPGKINYF